LVSCCVFVQFGKQKRIAAANILSVFHMLSLPPGYCVELVTRWVTVSEDEISSAVSEFCRYHHKIVEGAAGVAIAAFLKDAAVREAAAPAVIIACGANIATETVLDVLQR
jgi:threonine dehydratase